MMIVRLVLIMYWSCACMGTCAYTCAHTSMRARCRPVCPSAMVSKQKRCCSLRPLAKKSFLSIQALHRPYIGIANSMSSVCAYTHRYSFTPPRRELSDDAQCMPDRCLCVYRHVYRHVSKKVNATSSESADVLLPAAVGEEVLRFLTVHPHCKPSIAAQLLVIIFPSLSHDK